MLRVILYDLDGTLMETAPEIADAVNDTLRRRGHAPAPAGLVRSWVGDGARALQGKALAHAGEPASAVETAWPAFANDDAERCGTNSLVHDGVHTMLQRRRDQGLQQVLLTNEEAAFARPMPPSAKPASVITHAAGSGHAARLDVDGGGLPDNIAGMAWAGADTCAGAPGRPGG